MTQFDIKDGAAIIPEGMTEIPFRAFINCAEVIDISPGNLDSSLCFFQPSISHDVLCI